MSGLGLINLSASILLNFCMQVKNYSLASEHFKTCVDDEKLSSKEAKKSV